MKKSMRVMLGALVLLANSSIAATVIYENNFSVQGTVAPGSALSDNGWGGYVTDVDSSILDISTLAPIQGGVDWGGTSRGNAAGTANSYLWIAPKGEGVTDAETDSFLFSTDVSVPVSLASIGSMAVTESFDGSAADSAKGRFAIQIGTDWYVSTLEWSSESQNGAPSSGGTVQTLTGIDFADGNNWQNLTAAVGAAGVGDIAIGAVVGGTLTGDIIAFGVYIEHGNGGDHARIDSFVVSEPEVEAFYVAGSPTDWTDAAAWSDGLTATSGTIYYATNSVVLETPAVTATFPGISLSLSDGQRMEVMTAGADVITVPTLTMDAADLAAGAVVGGEAQIDGQITVTSNSTFSGATDNSRDLRILAQVIGGATVSVELDAPTKTIYIDNSANTFSGTWVVSGGTAEFASADSVGSANIEVQSAGALSILEAWLGFDSGDSLTVADSPTALVELGSNAWTVANLTIGGSNLVDSVYTVEELNAFAVNPVFSGSTGTIQVGPPPIPPQPELLVGWDQWDASVSPATVETNGITGVATNAGFVTSNFAGSNDGTFGTLLTPEASTDTASVTAGIRKTGATSISLDFLVQNTSGVDVELGNFHFDALSKTVDTGPEEWTLSVISGDLTVGGVITNDLDFVGATGNLADYDVDLTGLADHVLDAGGSVLFRLSFTGGAGAASNKLDIDNVAVTKPLVEGPTEQPVMSASVVGSDIIVSWTEAGFKLQTRSSLTSGGWADYPGGSTSPVTIPMSENVEFMRLVWP